MREMFFASDRRCIETARDIRLKAANEALREIVEQGIPFEGPASGISLNIDWSNKDGARTKQIAFFPVAILLVAILFVATPFSYIGHLRQVSRRKSEIRDKIRRLSSESVSTDVPAKKTLESLWSLHGVKEDECSFEERLNLLCDWVDILYGSGSSSSLRLRQRVDEIAHGYARVNRPYYEGRNAPRYSFTPPLDVLISELAAQLPLYEQIDNAECSQSVAGTEVLTLDHLVSELQSHYRQVVGLVSSIEGRFTNLYEAGIFVSSVATIKILSLQKVDPPAFADQFNAKWVEHLISSSPTNGAFSSRRVVVARMQEKFPVYRKLFLNVIDPARKEKANADAVQLMWELFTNCTGKQKPDDIGNFLTLELAAEELVLIGVGIFADVRE